MLSPKEREKQAKQARALIIFSGILLSLGGIIDIITFVNWTRIGLAYVVLIFSVAVLLGGLAVIAGGYGLPKGKLLDGISFGYSLSLLGFIGTAFSVALFHAVNIGLFHPARIYIPFYASLSLEFLGLLFGLYIFLSVSANLLKTFLFPTLPK